LNVESLRALSGSEKRGLSRAVDRYRHFLGVPVKLTMGRKG
jgi:hypothetical protein